MNEHGTGLNDTVCREGVSYSEALQALLNLIDETDVVYIMHNKVGLFQISEEGFQSPPRVAKRKRGIIKLCTLACRQRVWFFATFAVYWTA